MRSSLLAPTPEIEARIGGRPDTLAEREHWCRAAANLLARPAPSPLPTLDVDTLADLGREL